MSKAALGFLCAALWAPHAALAQAPALPSDDEEEEEESTEAEPAEEPLELRVARLEAELAAREPPSKLPITFHGYFDLGFFVPQGDGAGIVQDFGDRVIRRARPGAAGKYAWVFLGDLLSTAVNGRGEPADLGPDPGVDRFDSVNSRGALGAILNEANFTLDVGVGDWGRGTLSVNVLPRSGVEFSLGDLLELDLAQLELIVSDAWPTSIFAGKIEPVIGVEYKRRHADQRFGVTPSLIARYTVGSQLGVKARSRLFGGWVLLAAALTNGSATQESFHFGEELDSNDGKTVSGRAALRVPLAELWPELFSAAFELAFDGLYGPQDRATDTAGAFHLVGFDFEYDGVDLALRGQLLTGGAPGNAVDRAYGLELVAGGYAELDWMFTTMFGASLRGDFRNAWVTLGLERAYLSKTWRATFGLRAVFNRNLTLKLEYLHNGEYLDLPSIDNDVFTSSLVVSY